MKFTDGYWMIRAGFQPHYAAEANTVTASEKQLRVHATTRKIAHRGDTLGGPTLTIDLSSPLTDVIRVKITHFNGGTDNGPNFPLSDHEPEVQICVQDGSGTLTSGRLSASVDRENWELCFSADGRQVTKSGGKGIGYVTSDSGKTYVHEQLQLEVGELVYGLGERFTSFVKNGQVVELWNADGGTGSDQAYKNVPFYMTNKGYGVFINEPGAVSLEVASEKVSKVQFSVEGETLEYFLIYGPTPKEILEKYTAITGRPELPPAWTFGLWLTTSFTTSYDEATVSSFIKGMEDRDLPLHVFHFDCFWMRAFHWCDFEWDPAVFPDPAGLLKRLKERGLHVCVWINPYIGQESALFAEGKEHGYFLKRADGSVWQWDKWQPGMAIVDFTNTEARKWFAAKLAALVDMGVDSFKTDFGERIPIDAFYADGSDPVKMHNYYTYLYNECVFNLLKEKRGEGEAAVFARSATAGCQKFPVHWGGDCYSDFPSMAESLRGGLSLGLSGFGFWSHDIGGFEGMPPADVYKRWIAFGLLSSHSRLHGSTSYRVPWLFDEESCDVLRTFTNLKCSLMPYLFGRAAEARDHGWPVMRAMLLEFPDEPACQTLDRQYMLGDSLLVAPVFSADSEVSYYVPEGTWTDYFSGKQIEGGRWITEQHGYLTVPLLVRPNTALPVGACKTRPDYDYTKDLVIELFAIGEGLQCHCDIPDVKGKTQARVQVRRTGNKLKIDLDGDLPGVKFHLVNVADIQSASDCAIEKSPRGLLVVPRLNAKSIDIDLGDR